MPSIFARNRRASESLPNEPASDFSPVSAKRRSIDVGRPPVSGNKFKSIFSSNQDGTETRRKRLSLSSASQIFGEGDDAKQNSLRARLSSASQLFHHKSSPSDPTPALQPTTPTRPAGAAARYDDPSPRSPGRAQFASPTLFPENFALSNTASPEGGGRRGSVSWQPSYPTVVPDDSYADLAPDGLPATNGLTLIASPVMEDENALRKKEHRQSLSEARTSADVRGPEENGVTADKALAPPTRILDDRIPTPSPDEVPFPVMNPDTHTPPTGPKPPLTPPPSATSPPRRLEEPSENGEVTRSPRRPNLTLDLSGTHDDLLPIVATSTPSANQKITAEPGSTASAAPKITNEVAAPSPVHASGLDGKPRPDMPIRRTTLIQSPPMPQPIKNLPSMVGWPAFMREGSTPATPGWGTLAREGGPKTPGWTGSGVPKTPGWNPMMSPRTPATPGGGGFPLSLPSTTIGQNKGKDKSAMTEEELRKARRAMPVMLRQPTIIAAEPEGGEVGASDDDEDDESETEMEGHGEDDSEPETETERNAAASSANGKKPMIPLSDRFKSKNKGKGKGKAKAAAGVSPLATTALREEEDTVSASSQSNLPSTQSPAGQSRNSSLRIDTTSPAPHEGKKGRSFWSLPTPKEKQHNQSWQSFTQSPSATPATAGGPSFVNGDPIPPGTNSRTQSSTGSDMTDGYFGSQPSTASLATEEQMSMEPTLGLAEGNGASATLAGLGLGAALEGGQTSDATGRQAQGANGSAEDLDDGDASDEGSSIESPDLSSQDHHTSLSVPPTTETIIEEPTGTADATKPKTQSRPSFYSRPSRSMVDVSSSPLEGGAPLEGVRSRENAPSKIEIPARAMIGQSGAMATPTSEWAKPPPTPAAGLAGFFWSKNKEGKSVGHLKRRRSADDLTKAPPMYEPPLPGVYLPRPRDEEGKEKLPGYWCAVHIEGNLQRKMEFSQPGVQSRDRSWKTQYFILRGTTLLVFKFDPHRFPLKHDPQFPVPLVSEMEDEEHLHVHCPRERRSSFSVANTQTYSPESGRRGSVPDISSPAHRRASAPPAPSASASSVAGSRRTSVSSMTPSTTASTTSEKDAAIFNAQKKAVVPPIGSTGVTTNPIASHFQENKVLKQYTLQKAESGLAADYVKRKNVVRVRAEGEQFLLQTDSARDVVDWIEALQAATNVALDLDERPMPKIITLPRRRRRRVPGAPGATAATTAAAGSVPSTADTPEGNAAAVAAVESTNRDRMESDLAQDQATGTGN